ncbi:Cortical protein marker for cell polarity [compost metagenome]
MNGDSTDVICYDGSQFIHLPKSPLYGGNQKAIIRYRDKIFVGGTGLAYWDGNSWTTIDPDIGVLNLKVIDDKLFVVGGFTQLQNYNIKSVAIWNDTLWTAFPGLDSLILTDAAINDIAFYKNQFYLSGNLQSVEHPDFIGMVRFDGQQWHNVGNFVTDGLGFVQKLEVWNDTLYAGGYFGESSGSPGNGIAKWDGLQWHRLQQGVMAGTTGKGVVMQMAKYQNNIFVSGGILRLNGILLPTYESMAKWTGTEWCSLGNFWVSNYTSFGFWRDRFLIAGKFQNIDGIASNLVAEWIGGNYSDTCINNPLSVNDMISEQASVKLFPNPFRDVLHVEFNSLKKAKVIISIIDVLGQSICNHSAIVIPGINNLTLNYPQLNSGNYLLQIKGEDINISLKISKF